MLIDFTTIVTEQDGIDLFQSLIDNLDNEQEVKQFIKQIYALYRTNNYSEGMAKFYIILFSSNPGYNRDDMDRVYDLVAEALGIE